jgi:thiol-disulfide isomerase/thioredoxin
MAVPIDVRLLGLGVGLALALSGCGPGSSGGGAAASGAETDHELLGAPAPAFELDAVAGKGRVSTAAYAGQVVIVDFWATWCEPCKESFPFYQDLMTSHAGKVVVLGVSVDEEPAGIAGFVSETGVSFPVGWDEGQSVSQRYKPPAMPTSYVVDDNGIVRFVHGGFRSGDADAIRSEVGSLL